MSSNRGKNLEKRRKTPENRPVRKSLPCFAPDVKHTKATKRFTTSCLAVPQKHFFSTTGQIQTSVFLARCTRIWPNLPGVVQIILLQSVRAGKDRGFAALSAQNDGPAPAQAHISHTVDPSHQSGSVAQEGACRFLQCT